MLKKIVRASIVLVLVGTLFFLFPPHFFSASAANSAETTFQVNVQEVLSVAITTPSSWDSGDVNEFLCNPVSINVMSNNIYGFTASMISSDANARLYHSSKSSEFIPTLTATTARNSLENQWGFATDHNTTSNCDGANSFQGVASSGTTPNTLIARSDSSSYHSVNVYFGSKATIGKASGTYSGTVIFYVVSGLESETTNNNETTPTVPANPATDVASGTTVTDASNQRVVSTVVTGGQNNEPTTTTTTVSEYVAPQGVTDSTSSNIYDGSILNTALAVTASVAAASGLTFFILAKRKKDDDDEEETE